MTKGRHHAEHDRGAKEHSQQLPALQEITLDGAPAETVDPGAKELAAKVLAKKAAVPAKPAAKPKPAPSKPKPARAARPAR
jgi:hypothetical protein